MHILYVINHTSLEEVSLLNPFFMSKDIDNTLGEHFSAENNEARPAVVAP